MGKVIRSRSEERPRTVKMTSAWPPMTYSYFNEIPRRLNHRIKGGLKITYIPKWVEDTCTKVNYDVSENEEEFRLQDPGGLGEKPKKFRKRDRKYVKKFVEKQANGDLAEAGFPRGESIAVATNPKSNEVPLVVVAEKIKKEKSKKETTTGSSIFDEKTQPLENSVDEKDEFLDDINDYMNELDYEPEEEIPEIKQDPLVEFKPEVVPTTRTKHKEDIKIVKMCRLETPKTVDFKKDARRKINVSTPKSEQSVDGPSNSTTSTNKSEAEGSEDQVEYLGFYGKIHADDSGTGKEETTFEKQYRLGATNKIEQTDTMDITQPESIRKPVRKQRRVVYETQVFSESEEEIYGDGGDRFEEKEIEEFEIRRPKTNPEHRQQRVETFRHHRGCKLGRERHDKQYQKTDKEDSRNSIFCTPMSQPTTSMARCPLITRKISILREPKDECLNEKVETKRYHRHEQTQSRMSYARGIVEPEEEEEEDEEENLPRERNSFEELTLNEELLITGSSESFKRLEQKYGNQKDKYRKLVEKLMWRCGILCKDRMDRDQQKYLKRKTIPDFRRQVRRRSNDYVPHEYSVEGSDLRVDRRD